METSGYTVLSRQSGLLRELQLVANNVANANTTGYRQQGLVFSEFIRTTDRGGSVSMSAAHVRNSSFVQGAITRTGAALDLAIEGEGFFLVQTAAGERLTRNGAFTTNAQGDLVTHDGNPVLSAGGGPVFVPPGADDLAVARDGTLSSGGLPIGQIGLVRPSDLKALEREGATLFRTSGATEPVDSPKIIQGALESSNVDPILQLARLIEVQRAYEMGQGFLDREDERQRTTIKALFT
ncbi:flagellar hook-basal body complex protein [Salipiger mangrovisoli]|uniref:Flagellar basal-body rod protein FlgF n=1 Tax=Salipiger mangrovisoli TaxID=2865933 RepID=A0ABR9WXA4_9RHOB|nr:flagellar hook-basal body complex protein [Salipiger mangrovisoli]MBE9635908.1 flagellar hook-basal body complex protein [Salipiger mangrovisoli]